MSSFCAQAVDVSGTATRRRLEGRWASPREVIGGLETSIVVGRGYGGEQPSTGQHEVERNIPHPGELWVVRSPRRDRKLRLGGSLRRVTTFGAICTALPIPTAALKKAYALKLSRLRRNRVDCFVIR